MRLMKPSATGEAKEKKRKERPVYLRDHERMRLETKGAMAFVSDDEDDAVGDGATQRTRTVAFDADQRKIRRK